MPNYTLPIGPLHLITGNAASGNLLDWGLFTITNDAIPQYTLAPANGSSTVTAVIDQVLGSNGSFIVTFTLQNPATTLMLSGTVTNNLQISGHATITTAGLAIYVPFQLNLLPIDAVMQTHSNLGNLVIDANQNVAYVAAPSVNVTHLGSVAGFLNLTTGILSKVTFTGSGKPVTLSIGSDNYAYMAGTFFNSASGRGTIGPCSSRKKQQGDDTWTPAVQNK